MGKNPIYIALFALVTILVISMGGCKTAQVVATDYGGEVASLEELEGTWEGIADSQFVNSTSTCTVKMALLFTVSNGRAVSLCSRAWCEFDVPIKEKGVIRFKYKKALRYTSDYGADQQIDIVFKGQLFRDGGAGTFAAGGGCPGKWIVSKKIQ